MELPEAVTFRCSPALTSMSEEPLQSIVTVLAARLRAVIWVKPLVPNTALSARPRRSTSELTRSVDQPTACLYLQFDVAGTAELDQKLLRLDGALALHHNRAGSA